MNYYNEIDPFCRRWLRQLIRDGLIPDGFIDNRPIQEVKAHELIKEGFKQCHFFAGIGGWPLALRIAGVPDDEELWTGSCPCQPFSDSGDQVGFRDPRHLFPTFRRLIARCGPPVVIGEQVASKLGREWLARVRLEMASLGYATRGGDYCSAGVAAPNRRQRLYWLADADLSRCETRGGDGRGEETAGGEHGDDVKRCSGLGPLEDAACGGRTTGIGKPAKQLGRTSSTGSMGHADRPEQQRNEPTGNESVHAENGGVGVAQGDTNNAGREGRRLRFVENPGQKSPWSSGVAGLLCSDGKTRRIKPEIFPLAARLPGDLGVIRGAGNAINPWVAAKFIRDAYLP